MRTRSLALALVLALALGLMPASVPAATHVVTQTGLTFVPDDLTIEVGDTVEWQWTAGIHTVTEGTDDLNPPLADKLFDEPFAMATPNPSFTFTEVGIVDYYCRPHRTFGMTAVIRVQSPTPAPEVSSETWSRLKSLYR